MADRYTLPAKMGGYECEVIRRITLVDDSAMASVAYLVDGVRVTAVLPQLWLTPVKPPLPPEPPVGSVVLDSFGRAWQRMRGDRWGWDCVEGGLGEHEWEVVWAPGGNLVPVLLVEDPFAEPVQLPVTIGTSGTAWHANGEKAGAHITVELSRQPGGVALRYNEAGYSAVMKPDEMRDLCRAGWAAANQAEAGTEDHG